MYGQTRGRWFVSVLVGGRVGKSPERVLEMDGGTQQHAGKLERTHRSEEIQMVDGSTTTTQMTTSPRLRSPTKTRAGDMCVMVMVGEMWRHKWYLERCCVWSCGVVGGCGLC